MALSRAQKDRSEKCCMDNVEGNFYYGTYATDYDKNIIARRVIEYTPTAGMQSLIDEVFNYNDQCDGSNEFELFWRKVNGPESAMRVQYGTVKDNTFTGIVDLWWELVWLYT